MVKRFLDYYEANKIIPVHQEINAVHFNRRSYLYRALNILGYNRNQGKVRILEIGAGTGDNSVVTSKLFDASYTFVEANSASISCLSDKVRSDLLPSDSCIIDKDFLDVTSQDLDGPSFDLVLCEGLIPGQENPRQFASRVFELFPHARVVFTCADRYSCLPELLRRLLRPLFISNSSSTEEAICLGVKFFEEHLEALPSMSRTPHDWVADQIIHPWTHSNWEFSMVDAIDTAQSFRFAFNGSSPSYLSDWSWYKEAKDTCSYWNILAKNQWLQQRLCCIDKRLDPYATKLPDANTSLCQSFDLQITRLNSYVADVSTSDYRYSQSDVEVVGNILESISSLLGKMDRLYFCSTISAIDEFNEKWPSIVDGDLSVSFNCFQKWWGRGQQYISFRPHEDPLTFESQEND